MSKTLLHKTNNPKSQDVLKNYLDFLDDLNKGKEVEYVIEIKKNRPIRSISQNRYYRAILKAISAHCGYDENDLHEYYKLEFNGKEVCGKMIGESTSNLDSSEFTIYLNKVKNHGKNFFGAYIPEIADRTYGVWEQVTKEKYDLMFSSL